MNTHSQLAVGATYHGAEGWRSDTKLSYEDYARMGTRQSNKPNKGRRAPTPAWIFDDATVREVVTLFMEERAGLARFYEDHVFIKARMGSLLERLDRATERMKEEKRPQLQKNLAKLCTRYTQEPENRKVLAGLIENTDTQLRIIERGASIAVAVLHYYYRLGMDSVGVAQELNLKPPHIRQLLYRLNCTYKQVEGIRSGAVRVIPYVPNVQREGLDAQGRTLPLCLECGQPCKSRKQKCCSNKCAWKLRKRQYKKPAEALPGFKSEKLKFCTPDCRKDFLTHPWETIKKRFGIDLHELRKIEGASYVSYVVFAVSLKQVPLNPMQWRALNGGA